MAPLHDALHQVAAALFDLGLWAAIIQLAGAVVVGRSVVAATLILLHTGDTVRARLVVAQGVLWGLNLTLASTLLDTLRLQTWAQILTFAMIVALRIGLWRVFRWERARLLALSPPPTSPPEAPAGSGG